MDKEKDLNWERCKKVVDARDHRQCQLQRCLSVTEFHQLKACGPKTLDRCHIFPRSSYPKLIYNPNNIISLSRFIHQRLDNFQDPLYGDPISVPLVYFWWYRIKNHRIEKYDSDLDYEYLLREQLGIL